jgi:hypothetical protein
MLAPEFVQAREARVQFFEAGGIEVEVVAQPLERQRGLFELDLRAFEQGVDLAQPRLVFDHARELAAHRAQRGADRDALVAGQARERAFAALDQGRGMRLAAMREGERFDLGRREPFARQFRALVGEPRDAFADVALLLQFLQAPRQRPPFARLGAHCSEQRLVASEGVEQGELGRALEQGLMLVLAVDLDQAFAQFGQLRQRRGASVDPRARAAVGAQRASQLAVRALVELVFAQPGQRRRIRVDAEFGPELGAFGAVPHHSGIRARAGQEQQRVDEQGLARAGLARDHGKSRAQRDFDLADDREVLDVEGNQHGAGRARSSAAKLARVPHRGQTGPRSAAPACLCRPEALCMGLPTRHLPPCIRASIPAPVACCAP